MSFHITFLRNLFLECLYHIWTVAAQWADAGYGYAHSAYQVLTRQGVHILNAGGIVITITFAGASLYYAKAAADNARCQLELQKQQICESQPEEVRLRQPCEEILRRAMASLVSCYSPGITRELILAIWGTHVQEYSRCGDHLYDGEPWWHNWGGSYSTGDFRPILWRFPDVYWILRSLSDTADLYILQVGSLALFSMVMGRTNWNKPTFVAIYLVLLAGPLLFFSWLDAAELGQQPEYWRREQDWRYCNRLRVKIGENDWVENYYDDRSCMFWGNDVYMSWSQIIMQTLLRAQQGKVWTLFEQPSLYWYSNGGIDLDYWLFSFILRMRK